MPVTRGTYANVETQIYDYVVNTLGYNTAIACGILANAEAESNFNPKAVGDGGDAYGLLQWNSRREELFKYTKSRAPSVLKQLSFMKYELNNKESSARKSIEGLPNTAQGAYDAAYNFCVKFERPSDPTSKGRYRGELARDKYWEYYSKGGASESSTKSVGNVGKEVVRIARTTVGLDYIPGGEMYDTNHKGADSPGLVYYCYKEAGVNITRNTATGYYNTYKNKAKKVTEKEVAAGDLLFYASDVSNITGIEYVAIATGLGGRIYAKAPDKIVSESSLGSPAYILRILSDAETSTEYDYSGSGSIDSDTLDSVDAEAYMSFTANDPNALIISENLSRVTAEGYDYGYLIDVTNGGEFKFYIPEFTEQAGANWSNIELRGRSVSVHSYQSTESRSVTVSLELYAGVGLYKATTGESGENTVSRLHSDINFIKSLEYPDYTNAITRPPAVVHLILGSAFNLEGVVSGVSVEHLKPLDTQNRAMYVKVSFTVTQIAVNPPDWTDIRYNNAAMTNTEDVATIDDVGNALTNIPVVGPTLGNIVNSVLNNTRR